MWIRLEQGVVRRKRFVIWMKTALTLGSGFIVLVAGPLEAGGIYFSDRGSGELKRSGFHGGVAEVIHLSGQVSSAGTNVRGIAIDSVGEEIFWADNGVDRILRAKFDGTKAEVLHRIEGRSSFPADLFWSGKRRELLWCDRNRRHIGAIFPDGAAKEILIEEAAASGPYFMDWDGDNGWLYWGEYGGGAIYRSRRDGSHRTKLLNGNNEVRGVKVDPVGGMLYWVDRNEGRVYRCPLSELADEVIRVDHPRVQLLYSGLDTPHGLELDIPARKVYWADTGTNAGAGKGGHAVSRGDFDGSGPQEILVKGSQPWDVALDRRCVRYGEWSQRVFHRESPSSRTDPVMDPDEDGLVNALEYAFDLAPFLPNRRGGLLTSFLTQRKENHERQHGLRFHWRAGTADLSYRLEASRDMKEWSEQGVGPGGVQVTVEPDRDNMVEVTARTVYSVHDLPEHFIRLTVQWGGSEFALVERKPSSRAPERRTLR